MLDHLTDLQIGAIARNEMFKAYGRQYSVGNHLNGPDPLPDSEIEVMGNRLRAELSEGSDTDGK